ncbi:calcium-binding protein, partial [Pseudomonas asiatica]|uniref:calcium-binding protein n=1 Tax=Pseudomonas asiatica TaxID=2219225 RepID=UPI00383BA3DF
MAIINGNENANTLTGGSAADTLNGLGGNDTLLGNGGNDTLDGGTGNDLLIGGLGSDTYRFGQGYGFDVIDNSGGANNDVDTIRLTNLNANQIRLTRIGSDLVLSVLTTGETLTVSQHFLDADHAMDRIQFADGSRWDSNAILANLYYPAVTPTEGADLINGNPDDDVLQGLDGNDSLFGNGGNDLLDGGSGADRMEGGLGNDTYVVDNLGDVVVEAANSGDDTVQATMDYILGNNVERLILLGAANLNGTGNTLANTLVGNSGNNVLDGGDGADVLQGGAGNDTMLGGAGNDSLSGGDGNDLLDGGAGNDSMAGGTGDDLYLVAQAGDSVSEAAGEGNDTVRAAIAYTLGANLENLELTGTTNLAGTGNALDNRLIGNSGGNTLNGGAGNDWLAGRQGNDTYLYGLGYGNDVIDNSGGLAADLDSLRLTDLNPSQVRLTRVGDDLVLSVLASGETLSVSQHFLDADHAIDRIQFADGTTWTSSNILSNLYYPPATPTEGADVLNGNPGDDVLQGLGGNDTLFGNGGNDLLDGGTGADRLEGGTGNDTYVVDNLGDAVVEAANSGDDTVQASIDYTLGNNVERVTLLGAAHLNGTGNALANTLVGNSGNNQLDGGDGADVLQGGAGNDTLLGGAGNDSLAGGDGNDMLDGGAGNDSMAGGAGDDLYLVAQAGDSISEAAGAGSDTVRTAIAYTLGANLENLELTGTANLAGTGNALDNRLTGNSGRNTLNGGAGNDWLAGREGNDTYVYGLNTGNDEIDNSGGLAGDVDTLQLAGLNPADVRFQRSGNDLVMLVNSTSATLTVKNFYLGSDYEIDRVQFANGTLWNRATMLANVQPGATNGADLLIGSNGDDLIQALGGNDEIRALGGNDTLDGGTGDDAMFGGAGDDLYLVDSAVDQVNEAAEEGNDTVRASISYSLGSNVENLTLSGSANLDGTGNAAANQLIGNDGNNQLSGGEGDDSLYGGAGDDTLRGEDGNDVLQGGGGVDFLWGGAGDDTLIVGNGQVGTFLLGEAGNDTFDARNLSNGSGANLIGGTGNDTYLIDGSGDVSISDDNGLGQLNVVQFSANINPGDLHFVRPADRFNDAGNLLIEFPNGHRLFIGSMGLAYPQDSGEGFGVQAFRFADGTEWSRAEILHRAGWYFGTTQNESIVGSAGHDYLNGSAGDDQLNGLAGKDYVNGWVGNDAVAGGDGNDLVDGNDGDDVVSGGAGDDQLYGGYGNDILSGDSGNDVYHYFLGRGADIVDNRNAEVADLDVILLEDAQPTQVTISRVGNDLLLTLNTSDSITVVEYFLGGVAQVGEIRFANGTVWSPATVQAMFSAPPNSTDDSATTLEDTPLLLQASDFGTYSDAQNIPLAAVKITSLPALGSLQYHNGSAWVAVLEDQVISKAELDAGRLQFVPALNGNGSGYAAIGFKVSDGTDFAVNANTLSIDVTPVNDAPVVNGVPWTEGTENGFVSAGVSLNVQDPDGDSLTYTFASQSALGGSVAGFSQSPGGFFYGANSPAIDSLAAGEQATDVISYTVQDGHGGSANGTFEVRLTGVNDAPIVAAALLAQNASEDSLFSYTVPLVTFADVDVGDSLGYSARLANGDPLPSWLSFDPVSHTFSGTPGNADVGSVSVRVTATDGSGATASSSFTLTIVNTNDAPTLQIPPANQLSGLGRAFTYALPANTFADVDMGDSLTFSATLAEGASLPAWLSFDAGSLTFSGTPPAGTSAGRFDIVVTATDVGGLAVSAVFSLDLLDAIIGTPNADTLNGSVVADAIYGLAGSDVLNGFGGSDLLDGGLGFDRLFGGQGNDTLLAGNDADGSELRGEDGDDTLTGSSGSDLLIGGSGDDTLVGGSGNDTLSGEGGNDALEGGDGNDNLYDADAPNQATSNSIDAGAGDDTIRVYQTNTGSVTTVSGGSG